MPPPSTAGQPRHTASPEAIVARIVRSFLPLAAAFAVLPLLAQDREVRLAYLQQKAPESGFFPAATYNCTSLTMLLNLSRGSLGPQFVLSFGGAAGSSGQSAYANPAGAGKFSPGSYASLGLRLASPGEFSVAGGLEARFSTNHISTAQGAGAAEALGNDQKPQTRVWGILTASYSPRRPTTANPVFGVQAAFASQDGPNPNRELGLFAGIRF
jgi:hypothetical protein